MESLQQKSPKHCLGSIHILPKDHGLAEEPLQVCSGFFKLDAYIVWMCGSLHKIKVLHLAEFTALFIY